MPVRNEARWIARSVGAVLEQDYPFGRLEIVIADGMSDDNTIDILLNMRHTHPIRVVSNPQRTQAAGLNRAIAASQGDIIVRVDGHTVIARDYVRRCVTLLRETGAANVGGPIHPAAGDTPISRAIAAASKSRFAIPSAFRVSDAPQWVDTVYLGAWRREEFNRVGGFDERFAVNEDYEFNYRLRKAGGRIFYSPALCSEYQGPQTLAALAHQQFRYGSGKPRTLLKYPGSLQVRHLAAPLLVAWSLMGALISRYVDALTAAWLIGIMAYGAANLLCSFQLARRSRIGMQWFPAIFLTIHVAWGSGFWCGCIKLLLEHVRRRAGQSS